MAGQHYGGWRQRLEEVYFAGVGGGNAKLEEDELEWLRNLQLSWKQLFGGEPPLSSSSSTHLSSATFTRKGKGKARASDHAEGQPSFDDRPIEEQLCAAMLEAVLEVRKERTIFGFYTWVEDVVLAACCSSNASGVRLVHCGQCRFCPPPSPLPLIMLNCIIYI